MITDMINLVQGFDIGAPLPIDGRIYLSREEMHDINENILPEKYFAICKEDGKLYLYNKSNTRTDATGRFRLADDDLNERIDDEVATLNERIDTEVGILNDRIDDEVETLNNKIDTNVDQINHMVMGESTDVPENGVFPYLDNKIDTEISNESSARVSKDEEIDEKLSTEISDRIAAINELNEDFTDRLESEISSRELADQTLSDKIDGAIEAEQDARSSGDEALDDKFTNAIASEQSAREQADTSLGERITNEIAAEANTRRGNDEALDTRITNTVNALAAEQQGRIAADQTLASNISDEASARELADQELAESISNEASARELADNDLATSIANEKSAREGADSNLIELLNEEKSAREDADSNLESKINEDIATEKQERESADQILDEKFTEEIGNEISARELADQNLSNDLSNEISARELSEQGLSNDISNEAAARGEADTVLDGKISSEASAREEADEVLDGKISDLSEELSNRIDEEVETLNTLIEEKEQALIEADEALDLKIDNYKEEKDLVNFTELGTELEPYSKIIDTGNKIKVVWDDSEGYVFHIELLNSSNEELARTESIDLPIESLVVDIDYVEDSEGKALIIHLKDGAETRVPVDAIIEGLVNESTFNAHVNDTDVHIQSGERVKWNKADTAVQPADVKDFIEAGSDNVSLAYNEDKIVISVSEPEWSEILGEHPLENEALNELLLGDEGLIPEVESEIQLLDVEKQDVIDVDNKLNADLVDDTSSDHKFVSSAEKDIWDAKQDALTNGHEFVSKGTSTKVASITTNDLGQVIDVEEVNIAFPEIPSDVSAFNNDADYQSGEDVNGSISTHNSDGEAHSDIRELIGVNANNISDIEALIPEAAHPATSEEPANELADKDFVEDHILEITESLNLKQDELYDEGEDKNFKKINGLSLLGSGEDINISVPSVEDGYGLCLVNDNFGINFAEITVPLGNSENPGWYLSALGEDVIYINTVIDDEVLANITENSRPVYNISMEGVTSLADVDARKAAWENIYDIKTGTHSVSFYSRTLPEVDLVVTIKG